MEIHPAEHPILSWKDALFHLATVTVGILIALGLESIVEWRHHVALASEARENILTEIRDNRRELQDSLKTTEQTLNNSRAAVEFANELLTTRKTSIKNLNLGWNRADLSKTSWATAQTTGAVNYMPYGEIKSYANAYELQDEYVRLEQRTIDEGVGALALFQQGGDPSKMPDPELRSLKERLLASMSSVTVKTQIGDELVKRYSQVLSQPR